MTVTASEWALTGSRAVCGGVLVCRPTPLDRLQGGRMLAQAGAEAWFRAPVRRRTPHDAPLVYGVAAGVDILHAISMLSLAAARGHRRHALVSAAIASGFAAGDLLIRRSSSTRDH